MTTSNQLTPPVSTNEEENLKLAAQVASINLVYAQKELALRVVDPTISTKGLLDIAEHSYKVSGMAKKQEAKEDTGKFVFNINFSGGQTLKLEKDIGGGSLDDTLPPSTAALVEQATALAEDAAHASVELPEDAWH